MKLLVTTVDEQREQRDVLVNAAAATPVRLLAVQLQSAHQAEAPTRPDTDHESESIPLYLGDRLLDPDTVLASSGIRDGSTLGLGRPVPDAATVYGLPREQMPTPKAPDRAPVVEIQVIGGPEAGQVHRLGIGTHVIGPRGGSSVRLAGKGMPKDGLRLTVRPDGTVLVVVPEDDGQVRLSLPEAPPPRPRADVAALPPEPDPEPEDREPEELPHGWSAWELEGELVVGEHLLRAVRPTEADAAVVASPKAGLDFNRPPRLLPPLQPESFRLPGPPGPPKRRPLPFLVIIAPMFMGVAMVWIFHSFLYLAFMVLSPVMGIGNWFSGRRGGRKEYLESVVNYR
ncbi:MAG: hypothetical protein LBV78_12590, partial [Kitasatospora sp.]|nr:hypothetical protein [Kitasatospora sp.]